MVVRLLPCATPLHWHAMLDFYAHRALPGLEHVAAGRYSRVLGAGEDACLISVVYRDAKHALELTIDTDHPERVAEAEARVRLAFAPEADTAAIEAHLRAAEPALAPLLAVRPGLRPPGGWSGFELAVRAVLGQQITVVGARALATQLMKAGGEIVRHGQAAGLPTHAFPTPEVLLGMDLSALPMPSARRRTLHAVAKAIVDDPSLLASGQTLAAALDAWCRIPGIGPWTAHYIALRALRISDAFPASDAGLLRAARRLGLADDARTLEARSARWRPWRGWMAQHLWCSDMA